MTMLKTITPIDNSIYVEREYASSDEIENALSLSKKSFQQWKQTTLSERKNIVSLFVENFLKNNEEIEEQLVDKWEGRLVNAMEKCEDLKNEHSI